MRSENGGATRHARKPCHFRGAGVSIDSEKIAQLRDRQSSLKATRAEILRGLHAGARNWSEFHCVCAEIAKIDDKLRLMGKPRKRLPRELLWVNEAEGASSHRRK